MSLVHACFPPRSLAFNFLSLTFQGSYRRHSNFRPPGISILPRSFWLNLLNFVCSCPLKCSVVAKLGLGFFVLLFREMFRLRSFSFVSFNFRCIFSFPGSPHFPCSNVFLSQSAAMPAFSLYFLSLPSKDAPARGCESFFAPQSRTGQLMEGPLLIFPSLGQPLEDPLQEQYVQPFRSRIRISGRQVPLCGPSLDPLQASQACPTVFSTRSS